MKKGEKGKTSYSNQFFFCGKILQFYEFFLEMKKYMILKKIIRGFSPFFELKVIKSTTFRLITS
jgi:hypothetical protein